MTSQERPFHDFAQSEAFPLRSERGVTRATVARRISLSLGERARVRAEFPVPILTNEKDWRHGIGCGVGIA